MNELCPRRTLEVDDTSYHYYSLKEIESKYPRLSKLPFSMKVILENLLRFQDGETVTEKDIEALNDWVESKTSRHEIAWRPTRVLMQDFTGVPAIVDLAAMREAFQDLGGNPERISPLSPVDLVIDHSVTVDQAGTPNALQFNTDIEFSRNKERYEFLRWGQTAFNNFRVVPPGTGICHQVNLEYLGKTVWREKKEDGWYAWPDSLVGTDSHTTMINGLGILGWGVGGIEAEAAMLGQPVSMLLPEVTGVRLVGALKEGVTATDLVLTITEILRKKGVVGQFVEFFGPGLQTLPLADRATIANMAPEYGATCGFFPVDEETISYLKLSGRGEHDIRLVEAYSKIQGMWHNPMREEAVFTHIVELDLGSVLPSLAGPKRPQDKVTLTTLSKAFTDFLHEHKTEHEEDLSGSSLHNGDVVIAAITSCTNTSNPSVMIAAGLLAKKAREKGLLSKPWVKTSLAPGSRVVTDYLERSHLQKYLNELGFNTVGYGCTTCIGNSGPLAPAIEKNIAEKELVVSAVLSGNRNFEGRIHPLVRANWLASPPLVVAFALMGTVNCNLLEDPIGKDTEGNDVFLKDIWPSNQEIQEAVRSVNKDLFKKEYSEVFEGDQNWQNIQVDKSTTYHFDKNSTYIQHPPFFNGLTKTPLPLKPIEGAFVLALLGDSITTDHISPAGSIKPHSPAAIYLESKGVLPNAFNSYGARRGNHEVMMRGTFANIRIRNEMLDGIEGGKTRYIPTGEILPIYDAAMKYQTIPAPLVIIAGKEYGTGSSRDWAAKGTKLLGVQAVIAESFERIHRSNLLGMGVLPLELVDGMTRKTLQLTGNERFDIHLEDTLKPNSRLPVTITRENGEKVKIETHCRIDTANELAYYRYGGILQYVLLHLPI